MLRAAGLRSSFRRCLVTLRRRALLHHRSLKVAVAAKVVVAGSAVPEALV